MKLERISKIKEIVSLSMREDGWTPMSTIGLKLIAHGIDMSKTQTEQKRAVEAGYFPLYRYNPELKEKGKNPFILDSKEPTSSFRDFINGQIRYTSLSKEFPEIADKLFAMTEEDAKAKYNTYKELADRDTALM